MRINFAGAGVISEGGVTSSLFASTAASGGFGHEGTEFPRKASANVPCAKTASGKGPRLLAELGLKRFGLKKPASNGTVQDSRLEVKRVSTLRLWDLIFSSLIFI